MGELTRDQLEQLEKRFEVTTASSAVGALDRLDDKRFDCVVSDYEMPNTDWLELLEIVRERYPDLPFILFTGKGSEAIASEAIAAGVTDYMQKDLSVDQYEVLANRIQNAVEQYRTQEQFWTALSWYRQLLTQDVAGVFIVQDGVFAYVNDRFTDLLGYSRRRLLDRSPETIAGSTEAFDRLTELEDTGGTITEVYSVERADGTDRRLKIYGTSVE